MKAENVITLVITAAIGYMVYDFLKKSQAPNPDASPFQALQTDYAALTSCPPNQIPVYDKNAYPQRKIIGCETPQVYDPATGQIRDWKGTESPGVFTAAYDYYANMVKGWFS